MGIRPAKCYRWDTPAYTRVSSNPGDSFITGIPANKINLYDMGNLTAEFDSQLSIRPECDMQVRHNSMEAARIVVQKYLEKDLGVSNFHFKVNPYPHHVLRENVMATGAGADRVQQGMRQAFGKPVGRAARIKAGQPLYTIYYNESPQATKLIKNVLRIPMKKLPGPMKIAFK
ncbi:MAG: 50S ribosomal protein L16, partial [Candidatus Altiarchaeales archaeon]|nr:50S ribosomal protein L16 [Candidatus Altiarchaeales archaeon]